MSDEKIEYEHKENDKTNRLKLFVWEGFSADYTDGLAFAIANTETEARKLILELYEPDGCGGWGKLTIYEIGKPIAFAVPGGG